MSATQDLVKTLKEARDRIMQSIKNNVKGIKGAQIIASYMQSIGISNDKLNIYIVIRPSFVNDNNIMVDIENISLDESIQRTGICTELVEVILKDNQVDGVLISQVLSDSMRNFCKSRKFIKISKENSTYIKFRTKEIKEVYFNNMWLKHLGLKFIKEDRFEYTDFTKTLAQFAFRKSTQKEKQVANWLTKNYDDIMVVMINKPYKAMYIRRKSLSKEPFGKVPKYIKEYIQKVASSYKMLGELPLLLDIKWSDNYEKDIMSSISYNDYYAVGKRKYGEVILTPIIVPEIKYLENIRL